MGEEQGIRHTDPRGACDWRGVRNGLYAGCVCAVSRWDTLIFQIAADDGDL